MLFYHHVNYISDYFMLVLWVVIGFFFGQWASSWVGEKLMYIWYAGYNYDWLEALYMGFSSGNILAIIICGSPFFWIGIKEQRIENTKAAMRGY